MNVCSWRGSPTTSFSASAVNRSRNSGRIDRCTSSREPAKQTWPLPPKMARIDSGTAMSRSASAKTMLADLPPSSAETGVRLAAAAAMMAAPVALEPVKVIRSTRGSPVSGPATSSPPYPCTMLRTPSGSPASSASSPNRAAVSGVCGAGFSTTVLPKASAGATFQVASMSGAFHGLIAETTPAGACSE